MTIPHVQERVVGFHVLGPNAGEITQGFSIGFKLGAKKKDFDNLIGIHPTNAEVRNWFFYVCTERGREKFPLS